MSNKGHNRNAPPTASERAKLYRLVLNGSDVAAARHALTQIIEANRLVLKEGILPPNVRMMRQDEIDACEHALNQITSQQEQQP